MGEMADIFISYAREDRPKAQRLAEIFEARGLSVWWDARIQAGEVWDEVIERELDAARCVVVLWSATSVQKYWVRVEASEGLKRQILVPAVIESINPPLAFRLIQWQDLSDWSGETSHSSLSKLVNSAESKIITRGKESVQQEEHIKDQHESENRRGERGDDLRYNLDITLEEAFHGKMVIIPVPTWIRCSACNGTGARIGARWLNCKTCSGSGRVMERERKLKVEIPAGIKDGDLLRLAGEGNAGLGGALAGDFYVFISIRTHPVFRRVGNDLYYKVYLSKDMAAFGGQIEVPTIDNKRYKVKIPAGTQSGMHLRLSAKGMSIVQSNKRGDMFAQVEVLGEEDIQR